MNKFNSFFLFIILTLNCSCEGLKLATQKKKAAKYEIIGNKAFVKGTLGQKAYKNTVKMIENNPQVRYILMDHITGSVNEYYNQRTCKLLKETKIQTIALPNAQIYGGGIDFLTSGNNPVVSDSTYLGVSGWKKGKQEASELSKDDEEHKFYTDFYDSIGVDKDFYWYKLKNASSEETYWMPYEDVEKMNLANVRTSEEIENFIKEETPVVVLVGLRSYKSRYKILVDHGELENAEQLKMETDLLNNDLIASFQSKYTASTYYYFSMENLDKIQKEDFSVLMNEKGDPLNLERKPNSIYFLADLSSTDEMNLPGLILRYENYKMTPRYERTMSSVKIFERKLDGVVDDFNKDVIQMKKKLKIN